MPNKRFPRFNRFQKVRQIIKYIDNDNPKGYNPISHIFFLIYRQTNQQFVWLFLIFNLNDKCLKFQVFKLY